MLNTALLSRMSQKSQHTHYEEIILGRTCCEEAPQVVPAWRSVTYLFPFYHLLTVSPPSLECCKPRLCFLTSHHDCHIFLAGTVYVPLNLVTFCPWWRRREREWLWYLSDFHNASISYLSHCSQGLRLINLRALFTAPMITYTLCTARTTNLDFSYRR